jgi:phage baseplate assembly protein W
MGIGIDGSITMSAYETNVKESIFIILNTAQGERIMRPDFGCGIHNLVFETIDTTTLTLIEDTVRQALTLWEPRIKVKEVKISKENIDQGQLMISIDYTVNKTDNRFNLVYPFYISGER